MGKLHLQEKDIINKQTGFNFDFIKTLNDVTEIHDHDFYELFLILGKDVMHIVNGTQQLLSNGSMVFIRPTDVHFYEKIGNNDCQIINLAVTKKILFDMFSYLGGEYSPERLLLPELPPVAGISETEAERIVEAFERLNIEANPDSPAAGIRLRVLLIQLFAGSFLLDRHKKRTDGPDWLFHLLAEMQKRANFTEGITALKRLSNKSPEYLCRIFKKHLDKTPTEYINQLRLDYATSLLRQTDEKIIDISLDAGFENLRYFYYLFKKRYDMSPVKYRKLNRKTLVPLSTI